MPAARANSQCEHMWGGSGGTAEASSKESEEQAGGHMFKAQCPRRMNDLRMEETLPVKIARETVCSNSVK